MCKPLNPQGDAKVLLKWNFNMTVFQQAALKKRNKSLIMRSQSRLFVQDQKLAVMILVLVVQVKNIKPAMVKSVNTLKVIVGVVINQHQKILIAKSPHHWHCGGLWEFPGGKIERGESDQQALRRELQEELNITAEQYSYFLTIQHDYPEVSVELRVWLVNQFSGEVCGMEQQIVRWVDLDKLNQYAFPEANLPIIQWLNSVGRSYPTNVELSH